MQNLYWWYLRMINGFVDICHQCFSLLLILLFPFFSLFSIILHFSDGLAVYSSHCVIVNSTSNVQGKSSKIQISSMSNLFNAVTANFEAISSTHCYLWAGVWSHSLPLSSLDTMKQKWGNLYVPAFL